MLQEAKLAHDRDPFWILAGKIALEIRDRFLIIVGGVKCQPAL